MPSIFYASPKNDLWSSLTLSKTNGSEKFVVPLGARRTP
jgi:hypothetical protein